MLFYCGYEHHISQVNYSEVDRVAISVRWLSVSARESLLEWLWHIWLSDHDLNRRLSCCLKLWLLYRCMSFLHSFLSMCVWYLCLICLRLVSSQFIVSWRLSAILLAQTFFFVIDI